MTGQGFAEMRVILDYDGTLTLEDEQADLLRERSLHHLASEVLSQSRSVLERDYQAARSRILAHSERYGWVVNGQLAAYCDEGAYILNTSTMQELLSSTPAYRSEIEEHFQSDEYEPVMACVNQLFHEFTFDLPPFFRDDCLDTLTWMLESREVEPVVLTNSRGDKVRRNLGALGMPLWPAGQAIRVLGDVRQYDMSAEWPPAGSQLPAFLRVDSARNVDLRRPVYYDALRSESQSSKRLIVVADGFSLAGSLPLEMGIPFLLVRASYTPDWVLRYVAGHPHGYVLDELGEVRTYIESWMGAG